jgi:N4-(beta-N-acetylglucosaminyl)-L-asparaginase
MNPRSTRRQFLHHGAAAALVGSASSSWSADSTSAPAILGTPGHRPLVVASANGHRYRNGGPRTCIEEVWERLGRGEDVLESIVSGLNIVELDPEEDSVGYGGLPNAEGVVQLDACVMHGSKRRAGGVAALEGVRTPSRVAKAVADLTDHHLLVGRGAQDFARQVGFAIEPDLNTDNSRHKWLEWKRRVDPEHWLDPARRAAAAERARAAMIAEGLLDPQRLYGTIHCHAIDPKGGMAGATTTSGLAWKIPGRVGDSPILGAGNWVDADVGAAGSTGRGEANLYNLCSHLIVERMRQGAHPKDAAVEALRRVKANTMDPRLLNRHGAPRFDLKFYVSNLRGEYAGVALYENASARFAVCDANGPRLELMEGLLPADQWEAEA